MSTFRAARRVPEQLIYAITLLQEKIQQERGSVRRALNLT